MNLTIEIEKFETKGYTILNFTCGIIEPSELCSYKPLDPIQEGISTLGVIVKGSMPQWLISYYTHILHPTRFIAIYDPLIDAAVVIATHSKEQKIGNIITLK